MCRFVLITGIVTGLTLPAVPVYSNVVEDVCAKKAENLSGYKPRGLTLGDRQGRLHVSGSVSVGVSRSWGEGNSEAATNPNRETGEDRKLDARMRSYWKLFDDCMRGQ